VFFVTLLIETLWLLNIADDWIDDISKLDKRTNNGLWRMCQEVVIALYESLTDDICLEKLRKITWNLRQKSHIYFEPNTSCVVISIFSALIGWIKCRRPLYDFMTCSLICYVVSVINSRVSDSNGVGIFLDNKLGYNLIGKPFLVLSLQNLCNCLSK
jgi:hypothetical protein